MTFIKDLDLMAICSWWMRKENKKNTTTDGLFLQN